MQVRTYLKYWVTKVRFVALVAVISFFSANSFFSFWMVARSFKVLRARLNKTPQNQARADRILYSYLISSVYVLRYLLVSFDYASWGKPEVVIEDNVNSHAKGIKESENFVEVSKLWKRELGCLRWRIASLPWKVSGWTSAQIQNDSISFHLLWC